MSNEFSSFNYESLERYMNNTDYNVIYYGKCCWTRTYQIKFIVNTITKTFIKFRDDMAHLAKSTCLTETYIGSILLYGSDFGLGSTYVCEYDKDNCVCFQGTLTKGSRSGFCTEYYKNGMIKYYGHFKNDIRDGVGSFMLKEPYTHNNKQYYKFSGRFKYDVPYGKGVLFEKENHILVSKKLIVDVYSIVDRKNKKINVYERHTDKLLIQFPLY